MVVFTRCTGSGGSMSASGSAGPGFDPGGCMLRRHIVLLIAIRLSDGNVKPGGPLGAL